MKTSTLMQSLALTVLLAGSQGIVHAAQAAKVTAEQAAPTLNRKQVDEWLAKPGKVTVIDLRRPDEHQAIGTLPVYLSIQIADLEKYLDYIPRDRAVIAVSNHAGRAKRAATVLVKNGFNVVGVAGAQDYEAEGGSLSKLKPPPKADTSDAARR
jgi:rhodanese-related sulfurtransferase